MAQAIELLELREPHLVEALCARADEVILDPTKRRQLQAALQKTWRVVGFRGLRGEFGSRMRPRRV